MEIHGNTGDKVSFSSNSVSGGGGVSRAAAQMNNLTQATMDKAMSKEGSMPVSRERQSSSSGILRNVWLPENIHTPARAEKAALLRSFSEQGNLTKVKSDSSLLLASAFDKEKVDKQKEKIDKQNVTSTLYTYEKMFHIADVKVNDQLTPREQKIFENKGAGFDASEGLDLVKKLKEISIKENLESKLNDELQAIKDQALKDLGDVNKMRQSEVLRKYQ